MKMGFRMVATRKVAVFSHIRFISLLVAVGISKTHALVQPTNRQAGHPKSPIVSKPADASTSSLKEMQRAAAAAISSFEMTEDFDPKLANGHVQSILGFFLRESCSYVPRNEPPIDLLRRIQKGFANASSETDNAAFWDQRERIETPDGDWFHVDYKYTNGDWFHVDYKYTTTRSRELAEATPKDTSLVPTVILLHGLTSSSYGNVAVEMARAFAEQGMNVAALNFRGCSKDESGNSIPNDTLGAYHLGFTDDLLHFLDIFREREPMAPIYLTGFSLGANVVLKCLGDLAERAASDWNIKGAVTLCAPLDQMKNAPVLARPFSIQRFVYTDGLLKSLKKMATAQLDQLQAYDKVSLERIKSAETISEFDDAVIAPIYGFTDCWEYYRQTSSIRVLHNIAVPTLILNAKDDPFFDNSVWPTELSCENEGPAPLKMVQLRSGGHLGFILQQVDDSDPRIGADVPSFASHTAAKFLKHIHIQAGCK